LKKRGQEKDVRKHFPPKRPFVAVTFAMTVDGKITTKNFTPVDFTSREDKMHLLRQRALGDAALIGHSTLKHDNVRLGLPHPELREARIARGQTPYPIRVIVSNEGRIDSRLKIFQSDISPIVIFSTGMVVPESISEIASTKSDAPPERARHLSISRGCWNNCAANTRFDRWLARGATLSALSSRRIWSINSISRSRPTCSVARTLPPDRPEQNFSRAHRCSLLICEPSGECFLTYRITAQWPQGGVLIASFNGDLTRPQGEAIESPWAQSAVWPPPSSRLHFPRLGRPNQLAAAFGQTAAIARTLRAKSALIAANMSNIAVCQSASASLALCLHL
jgi:hypothetical protein